MVQIYKRKKKHQKNENILQSSNISFVGIFQSPKTNILHCSICIQMGDFFTELQTRLIEKEDEGDIKM